MESDKKFIRRTYFVHQYEKEEAFLSKMAREGWHYVKHSRGILAKYEFVKGEPASYLYQLDYVLAEEDTEDYHQLYSDAGWEEVYSLDGIFNGKWYCFRKVSQEGIDNRLYTDEESKFQLYNRLMKTYGLFFLAFLLISYSITSDFFKSITNLNALSSWDIFKTVIYGFLNLTIILYIYLLVGVSSMYLKLKRRLSKKI